MTYKTQSERWARRALLRTLASEYKKAVLDAADMFVYSGSVYTHKTDNLDAINARIRAVYLDKN